MVLRWLGVALVLALAGCARPSVGAGEARDAPAIAGSPSCSFAVGQSTPSPAGSKRPLPKDFVPVTARRCVLATVAVPGDGEWQVRDEQEATEGLDRLTAALRQPSSPRADGPCPAIGVMPVDLTLTDAGGQNLDPSLPSDACGLPLRGATEAVEGLPWKSVKQTKVGRVRSQLEIDSGCSGQYKPVVAFGKPGGAGPVFNGPAPAALTVCAYTLDPAAPITIDSGPPLAMGVLQRAGTLTGANLTRVLAALDAAPPAKTAKDANDAKNGCDQPQQPFAVLGAGGTWIAVELGGCHRFVDGANRLRQLDAATVELIADSV